MKSITKVEYVRLIVEDALGVPVKVSKTLTYAIYFYIFTTSDGHCTSMATEMFDDVVDAESIARDLSTILVNLRVDEALDVMKKNHTIEAHSDL